MRDFSRVRMNKLQREAEGYLELGLPQQALNSLGRLSESGRKSTTSLYLQGEALRAMSRFEEAVVPLRQAAKAEPENIHVWMALGWCYKRSGQIDLAIDALLRALEADPEEPILHYNLACYYSLANAKDRALERLSRALAINPELRQKIDGEPDFDPLRNDQDFLALTSIIV